jgi:hypothetical protein
MFQDIELDKYYTKEEVDNLLKEIDLSEFFTKEEVEQMIRDIGLEGYYTKDEVDNLLKDIQIDPDSFFTKEEIEDMLKDLALEDYYKKTEVDELLNNKANNLFETDMVTVSALGGIPAGTDLNGMSLQDIFTLLLYPYVKPTLSASLSVSPNGSVFEYGTLVTINSVTARITKKSNPISYLSYLVNGSVVHTDTNVANGGTFSRALGLTIPSSISNSYIQCKVYDGANTVTANTSAITFCYPYYYGALDSSISTSKLANMIHSVLTKDISTKGNKTYTFTTDYQRMVIAYPTSYGQLKSIIDPNGFEVLASFTCSTISIVANDDTVQSYYVYLNEPSTNTNFKIQFKY